MSGFGGRGRSFGILRDRETLDAGSEGVPSPHSSNHASSEA